MASAMGGASANRQVSARAPEKGSFPLDHFNECRAQMTAYMKCMKEKGSDHAACREFTKDYLNCRMDNGLMAREDLEKFGLNDAVDLAASREAQRTHVDSIGRKYEDGFVAGLSKGYRKQMRDEAKKEAS